MPSDTVQKALEPQPSEHSVTDLQQARLELQAAKSRFSDLFEQAPIGYFIVDAQGLILQSNRFAASLLQVAPGELATQAFVYFVARKDQHRFQLLCRQLMEGGPTRSCALHMEQKDGTAVSVRLHGNRTQDAGGVAVLHMTVTDISQAMHAELSLKKSEKFSQVVLNAIADEVVVLDREGLVLAVNQSWQQYGRDNGHDAETAAAHTGVGSNYLAVGCASTPELAEDNSSHFDRGIRAVLDGSLPSFNLEYPCHSPGQQRWFSMTVNPMGEQACDGVIITHNEITRRIQLAQERQDAQTRLENIASQLPGMVYQFRLRVDGSSCFPYVSEKIRDLFDLTPAQVAEDASSLFAMIHPDDRDAVEASVHQSAQELMPWSMEYRLKFGDGTVRWVAGNSLVQREADGCTLWHGYTSDVTARKQTEEALLQAGALQTAIFNSANFSSIATDYRGVIQIFNVGAERMLGYLATDVLNTVTPADISDPQELLARAKKLSAEFNTRIAPGFEALVFKASRGIEDIYELTYIRQDGSRFPAMVSVTALRNDLGTIIGYLLIGTDNTARKEIEREQKVLDQRLRDQQFYTRSLIESSIDGLMTTDREGVISDVNKQMELLTGCTRDELIGAPFKSHFTDPALADACIAQVLGEKTLANYELTVYSRDGTETVVSINASTFYDRNRKLQGVVAAARDVTERKRLDRVLRDKNNELEAARLAAEGANRAKTDFLANMSHEIRSPLNAILGLSYMLEKASLELDTRSMVENIRASGRTLLGLISDILDVSKIEAGQIVLENEPFRLADVLDNLSATLAVAVGDKKIEWLVAPPPKGVATIQGDALRLEQVLNNLCSNASKFTESGRIDVRVEVLASGAAETMLRFSVLDTGIGIAPELQGQVFAAFTQADSSITRRFGGTGLGLTICRQLVGLMGGEIGVHSTQGAGSEFWFTLPLQEVREPVQPVATVGALEVLIAGADAADRTAVGAVAQGLGWQVTVLDSGAAVLAHLLQRRDAKLPDVVVLDWKMPGMDGLATARAIRHNVPPGACATVVATSTALASLAAQTGVELVDAILHTPFTAVALHKAAMEAQRRRAASVGTVPAMPAGSPGGLVGVRILIVDDSEINLDVAGRILIDQGASVSFACNGQEAIDWLLAHADAVDLVLMDVQMPVMDGMEATRRLRRLPQFDDLPIIALTAGAFKSQHSAAKAAGMTHIVNKPFDVPATIALIQRLRRRPATVPAAGNEGHWRVDALDVATGLQICPDRQAYCDNLHRFIAAYRQVVPALRSSLAQGQLPEAAALAHRLYGVAGNLALPGTRRLADELQRTLENGGDAAGVLAALDAALQDAFAAISSFAATPLAPVADAAARPREAACAMLVSQLPLLMAALDGDHPAPAKALLEGLEPVFAPNALDAILACVHNYDFRGAEACTLQLASAYGVPHEGARHAVSEDIGG